MGKIQPAVGMEGELDIKYDSNDDEMVGQWKMKINVLDRSVHLADADVVLYSGELVAFSKENLNED